MPFAYNLGFFASKSEQRANLLVQNLIAHFVFGTGLFIGLYISINYIFQLLKQYIFNYLINFSCNDKIID